MAQYCPICDQITNCTEDCKQCLQEENIELSDNKNQVAQCN